jgi:hypothetical protein
VGDVICFHDVYFNNKGKNMVSQFPPRVGTLYHKYPEPLSNEVVASIDESGDVFTLNLNNGTTGNLTLAEFNATYHVKGFIGLGV